MSFDRSGATLAKTQDDAILAALTAKWQTTRSVADQTPWAVLTIIHRLDSLTKRGLVWKHPGAPCWWRLRE